MKRSKHFSCTPTLTRVEMKKNYFYFWNYFGIANVWVLWFAPLYLLTVFLAIAYIGESFGMFLSWFEIALLGLYDLFYRVKFSQQPLFDALTFPAEGLIFHFFIFPFPVWMASGIVLLTLLSVS